MKTGHTVAVLLTCHNRVNSTLKCLSHLFEQTLHRGVRLVVYLVDDGSTDGTSEKVTNTYPEVKIILGDGSLFWNRGMHRAFGEAIEVGFDYYLWLNDDTYLYRDSLKTMLGTHEELCARGERASIVVASTKDSRTGNLTYGGYRRTNGYCNPLRFRLQPPSEVMTNCDTMCGNCVLIPKEVVDVVGNVDSLYRHRWGDVDYGLRARANNCEVWIAPGYLADCDENPNEDRWRDNKLSLRMRIQELHSLKGLGKADWLRFVRVHGGTCWPAVWIRPYLRMAYDSLK